MTGLRVGFVGAGEVVANSGHSLSLMAELAGPLLAKDVGIFGDLVGRDSPGLLQAATATINAMHLHDPVQTGAR